jgi:hypothetical protein
MRYTSLVGGIVIAALAATVPGYAQESGNRGRQRSPGGGQAAPRDGGGQAGRREGSARVAMPRQQGQQGGRQVAAPAERSTFFAQRQAQPRGGRPRGDNPRTGTAVPRGDNRGGSWDRGGRVIVRPGVTNRYYSNRYYYAGPRNFGYGYGGFGYGAFGLGYGYYDPFYYSGGYYGAPFYPGFAGGIYAGSAYNYDFGKLRLDVRPRDAEVYIDGDYVGRVDDFDGRLQGLTLETGGYSVEIVAPGVEPLTFDVRITPGRTTTYRGDLLTRRP